MANLNITAKLQDEASAQAGKIADSVGGIEGQASAASTGFVALQTVGVAALMAIVAAAALVVAGIGAFAIGGVQAAMDMEAQMSNIAAVLSATKDEVEPLGVLINDLGLNPNLKVSAVEAADAIEMLARNGLDMTEILDGAAESTVLLANSTGADFATAANIGTDAMAIFNINAEDMITAVDGITAVTTASKFGINDYALALAQGGGVAATAGVDFDDFNTTIAAISPLFASGSDAGTSFKTFLTRLIPQSNEAADAMAALGLEFFDSEGNMKDMGAVVGELNDALYGSSTVMSEVGGRTAAQNAELQRLKKIYDSTQLSISDYAAGIKGAGLSEEARAKKLEDLNAQLANAEAAMKPLLAIQGELVETTKTLTEEERTKAMTTIFGSDAMRAAASLANMTEEEYAALAATMGETSAADAAATRMDNLAGVMEIISGVIDSVQLQLGQALLPTLRLIANAFLGLANKYAPLVVGFFTSLTETLDRLVPVFQNVIAAVQSGGLMELFAVFEDGSSYLGAFLEALGYTEEQANALATGFISLVEPIITAVSQFVSWKDVLIALGIAVASVVLPLIYSLIAALFPVIAVFALVVGAVALLRNAWETDFMGIRTALITFWEVTAKPALEQLQQWLAVNLPVAIETLKAIWAAVWPVMQTALSAYWDFTKAVWTALFNFITTILIPAITALWNYWVNVAWPAISAALMNAWAIIQPILIAVWDYIVNTIIPTVQELWNKWVNVWWPAISTALTNAWTIIKSVWTELGRWINDNIVPWIEFLHKKWVLEIWPAIQKVVEDAWAILKPIWEKFREYLEDVLPPALEGMRKVFETVMNAIDEAVRPVADMWKNFVDAVSDFWNWLTSHKFEFNISIPDLPDWATPGSPLPIHTAWKDFAADMSRMSITPTMDVSGMAGGFPSGSGDSAPAEKRLSFTLINPQFYGVQDADSLLAQLEGLAA